MDTPSPSPDKHLFLLATSTEEKIERYQAIADSMGLPFVFVNLKKLALFHSALEDTGSMIGNVHQKMGEIDPVYEACRKENSPERKALMKLAQQYGVDPQKTDHIHFAADDATFTVPRHIWDHLWSKLASVVGLNILASGEDKDQCGPGAEIGPILAAAGVRNFFNMIRESAVDMFEQCGVSKEIYEKEPVTVSNHTTLSMRSLADPAPRDFRGDNELALLTRKELSKPFQTLPVEFDNTESWFVNSNSFTADPKDKTLSRRIKHNLEHGTEGRFPIVKELARSLGVEPSAKPILSRRYPPLPQAKDIPPELEVLDEARLAKDEVAVLDFTKRNGNGKHDDRPIYDMLKPIEQTIRNSEGFVFKPISVSSDKSDRLMAQLYLQSIIVAKQLEPRDLDKPVVIMNLKPKDSGEQSPMNGWEDAIVAILDQARKGMIKEYDPRLYGAKPLEMDGVTHQMTSDFEVVSGTDEKKLNAAAQAIINTRLKHRVRTTPPPPILPKQEGDAAPDGMYKVAVWTSATSDNKRLLDDLHHLGGYLANHGNGLIWGAGDRHGMGAVFDGYHEARLKTPHKTWIGAFSTSPILISESKYGDFPKDRETLTTHLTDYRELNRDIYERMAHMIEQSDAIVVAPGGAGTNQEWLTALMVKRQSPEKMKDKPIILFAPDLLEESKVNGLERPERKPFWKKAARAFLGANAWDALEKDGRSKAKDGIYLAKSKDELEFLLGELKRHKMHPEMKVPETWSTALPRKDLYARADRPSSLTERVSSAKADEPFTIVR